MINVKIVKQDTSLIDLAFSYMVKIVQKIVPLFVKFEQKTKFRRKEKSRAKITTDKVFVERVKNLGLESERLWWGPMTLNPTKIKVILDEIDRNPPKKVLEVGSGTSTALLAAAGKKYGFEVISLENFWPTVKYVEYLLEGVDCHDNLIIQMCNFGRYTYPNGDKYRWYNADLNFIHDEEPIDLVVIDGPMSELVGRNGALPRIIPFLAEDHIIFLDDSNRKHESECIEEWSRHYPQLEVSGPSEKTGMAVLKIPNIKALQSKL